MYLFFCFIRLLCSTVDHAPKEQFICQFQQQYDAGFAERPIEQIDTNVIYIAKVMNIHHDSNRNFDDIPIDYRRHNFFSFFLNPDLIYVDAINAKERKKYHHEYVEYEYFRYSHVYNYFYTTRSFINCPPYYSRGWLNEMNALCDYINTNKVDYIFIISNIYDINGPIYWIIRDNSLFVIRYDTDTVSFIEYDAEQYLTSIAGDDIFSIAIRLSL